MCLHCLPIRPAAHAVALLMLVGCGRSEAPAPPRPAVEHVAPPPPAVAADPEPTPPPFDAPRAEFDTVEAPARRLQPPARRPAPPDERPPAPPPDDRPAADRPPGTSEAAGSCDARPAEAFCFTYVGAGWTPAAARAHCGRAPGARFSSGPCPTADRVGTCFFARPGAPGEALVYEYYAPYPTDLARLACPGTFTASEE